MKIKNLFAVLFAACAMTMTACENLGNGGNGGNGEGNGDSDMTFEITVSDITTSGATVTVVPSDETSLYYFDRVTKEVYKTFDNDKAFMEAMIENLRQSCEESGASLASAISVGEDGYTYSGDLTPATEYYIYAFAVDAKLNPNSSLALEPFTTLEAQSSANTFTVSVNGSAITVTPSNNDQYFWDLILTEECQGVSDEVIMQTLIDFYKDEGYLEYYLVRGVDTFDYNQSLTAGVSYTVCVFGFEGMPTTELTKYTFTYEGNGSGGDNTGDDYGTTTLTGNVTLNIASAEAYYYGDYYDWGTNNWEIGFFDSTGREFVLTECFTTLSQSTPEGNYTVTADAGDPNTAFTGEFDDEGYILPTYYGKVDSKGDTLDAALIASGSFSIAKSGSNYTINLDLADILEHKVTGSYTGPVSVAMGEVSPAQAAVGSRAHRRAAHFALRRFSSVATIRAARI